MMQTNTIHESDGNVVQTAKSFADLPPEMVIAIFNQVSTSGLLNFRLVNRQWNKISTEIIRNRDMTLYFKPRFEKFMQRIVYRNPEKLLLIRLNTRFSRDLQDLVGCLQNSKNLQRFPCTAFQFDGISGVLGEDIKNFLKIFGENIRSLKVEIKGVKCNEALEDIFKSTPNLKKIEIWSFDRFHVPPSVIGISFDPHRTLLNLEALSVNKFHEKRPKIIEDILTMSPKLKRVSFGYFDITAKDLEMLESTNKLHCLKTLKIRITKDIIAHWKRSLKCFDFQLESLDVAVSKLVIEDSQLKLDATEIVSKLFHSSKDVMHTLSTDCINMLRLLSESKLPKLEKLQTLRLSANFPIVHPLLNWLTSLTNIKELDLRLYTSLGSLKSHQICLPSVEIVRIHCKENRDIQNLIKMTPNAQTLLIDDVTSFWYERIIVSFDEISPHVPKLVNFGWKLRLPENDSKHKVDAVLTGLPENLCKELAEKFGNKDDGLSAEEIAAYQRERIRSSILDLKDLRHLELVFFDFSRDVSDDYEYLLNNLNEESDEIVNDPDDGHFDKKGLTKVSKLLGFDLIPDLKVFIYRDSL